MKRTICAELARIDDDETLRVAAQRICELKPTTGEAIAMIRRWRGVRDKQSNHADKLYSALFKATNDYLRQWPDAEIKDAEAAMVRLLNSIRVSA